jgi:hypothetical protein
MLSRVLFLGLVDGMVGKGWQGIISTLSFRSNFMLASPFFNWESLV